MLHVWVARFLEREREVFLRGPSVGWGKNIGKNVVGQMLSLEDKVWVPVRVCWPRLLVFYGGCAPFSFSFSFSPNMKACTPTCGRAGGNCCWRRVSVSCGLMFENLSFTCLWLINLNCNVRCTKLNMLWGHGIRIQCRHDFGMSPSSYKLFHGVLMP